MAGLVEFMGFPKFLAIMVTGFLIDVRHLVVVVIFVHLILKKGEIEGLRATVYLVVVVTTTSEIQGTRKRVLIWWSLLFFTLE